jgi:hypothetical protein
MKFIVVNNAGDSPENPVVKGLKFRVTFNKHDSTVTITRAWITHGSSNSTDLTDLTTSVTESDEDAFYDAITGTELKTATPSLLNVLHWTTSDGVHVKRGLFCAERPEHEILFNGYDAKDVLKPRIIPTLLPFGVGGT